MEAMASEGWEPALSFPLPANPGSKLLREARRLVLSYLDWITSDNGINSEGPDWAVDEIRRASERLIEICAALPAAVDAESEAETEAGYRKENRGTGDGRRPAESRKAALNGHDR